AYKRWQTHGKDLPGRGTIVAEYEPPAGLSPAESGVVLSYRLDTKHVSATIIDLAIRKYIRINEVVKKKLLKDKTTYSFILLNTDWSQLKKHESKILGGIFTGAATTGKEVELDDLKNKFYTTIQSLQSSMPKRLTPEY